MDDAGASFATPCVLVIVFPFGKNLSSISQILREIYRVLGNTMEAQDLFGLQKEMV